MKLKSMNCIFGALAFLLMSIFASTSFAQGVEEFFQTNCKSCHTIGGGPLIGPDLKNATDRQDREWLVEFMLDPQAMIHARDPYALKLQKEAKDIVMITVPGMTEALANSLLDLIEAESELEVSQFVGVQVATGALAEVDIIEGGQLFTGSKLLKNGGPSCISCHSVNRPWPEVGGNLGPDLTQAYSRMQGRAALTAWLSAPPTTTMQSVFKKQPLSPKEVRALVALLESSTTVKTANNDILMIWLSLVFYGFGGVALILIIFGGIWKKRFRAVRRPLVDYSNEEVKLEREQINYMD
jgi:mono/diheme cytochrome c family protein